VKKKPVRRGTPRRRPRRKPTSTALVRRPTTLAVLPVDPVPADRTVTDGLALGALGLVEIKLTDQEEAVLNRPVDEALVLVKPTGQPYLSHPAYTRWLNAAFGRTGWALVPVGKAALVDKSVTCPYVLHIHRQPVAFAIGEQEYHPTNREQTYGDALEATVASALRRCMKRLGVGLELWDREWLRGWLETHAVRVKVNQAKRGQPEDLKTVWRKRTDPPFWNEVRGRRDAGDDVPPPRAAKREEPAGSHTQTDDAITELQRRRFGVIVRNSGRSDEEVRLWLQRAYGWSQSSAITRRHYEAICAAIEAPADLPAGRA
jgi:hypothetical protein